MTPIDREHLRQELAATRKKAEFYNKLAARVMTQRSNSRVPNKVETFKRRAHELTTRAQQIRAQLEADE